MRSDSAPTDPDADSGGATDADLEKIELWFVERGVPHFVERKTDGSFLDAWTRALPLLAVAYLLLGAFSGMYFTVVLTTDDTYRTEFSDDAGPEIREALAVRTAYRVTRGTYRNQELT